MNGIYIDTSSLVKVFHEESDSNKKVKYGELTEPEAILGIRFFENDYDKFKWVLVDKEIIHLAKKFVSQYWEMGLRTLDSIQLACAVSLKSKADNFLTSDKILKRIMEKEGLTAAI